MNEPGQIAPLHEEILKVICYYDIFDHPLTLEEIEKNISVVSPGGSFLKNEINELIDEGLICAQGGYYFLFSNHQKIISSRKEKETRASRAMGKAFFFSGLIGKFPFVKGVCISGSLSKGVLDAGGDVDYFVITEPGRLWICRSFLILFKKIFLFNSHKYFCTNYFVDTGHLAIPDENIFTATEASHLLPVVNYGLYERFVYSNDWIKDILPNSELRKNENCRKENRNFLKRVTENMLSGSLGEWLDDLFFKITLRRWRKKFPHFNKEDFDLNLRTRKNVSKHHPRGYQQKVLTAYHERAEKIFSFANSKTASVA